MSHTKKTKEHKAKSTVDRKNAHAASGRQLDHTDFLFYSITFTV